MAGTGSARGGLGWVILVVALAVPGVLFYNWWSHLKAEREKSVAAKAHGRVPEGGVFQAASPNAKLVNPMTPAVSTDTAPAPVAAGGTPPAAASDAQAAVSATPAPAPIPAAASTVAAAAPLKRDPTMSPLDAVRIAQEEEARRRAAEDLANLNAGRQARVTRKVKNNPVDTLELQGIISNPESGFKAIVNNEVVGVGEMIGSTGIKVLKINDLGVTFLYQGKRFSKGVSRD